MTSPALPSLEELRAAVERDADRLVEELFAGFEGGDRLKASSAGKANISPPASLALRQSEELAVLPETLVPEDWEFEPAPRRSWGRWFFLGASVLLCGSLVWFWRGTVNVAPAPAALPVPAEGQIAGEGDRERQEFIAYLQKALAAIERDERHARQLSAAKAEREQREQAERAARAEQARAAAAAAPQAIASLPQTAPVTVPLVPPPPSPVVVAQSIAPSAEPPATAPPQPPAPAQAASADPPSEPVAARVEPAPSLPTLEVLGSLEIGNLALALIAVNGSTERIAVGESIPGTPWQVMAVEPHQVVLQNRDGRERAVPVGGRF